MVSALARMRPALPPGDVEGQQAQCHGEQTRAHQRHHLGGEEVQVGAVAQRGEQGCGGHDFTIRRVRTCALDCGSCLGENLR